MPLRRTVHAMLQRAGFDVVRYDVQRLPERRRVAFMEARRIDVVLDVGANEGLYAESLRAAGYTGRIVSFEPLSSAYAALERRAAADPAWEARRLAIGEAAGSATFHIAGNSSSSSLLPMRRRHVESAPDSAYVGEEEVEVRTLDEAARELVGEHDRVWLKLDVQGYELAALRGAARTLAQTPVVELELSLVELYEGQALFVEVQRHLDAHGFGVWFLEPVLRDPATAELLQLDGIFARRS